MQPLPSLETLSLRLGMLEVQARKKITGGQQRLLFVAGILQTQYATIARSPRVCVLTAGMGSSLFSLLASRGLQVQAVLGAKNLAGGQTEKKVWHRTRGPNPAKIVQAVRGA